MKIISNQDLDRKEWDHLMITHKAPIYQYSWYLDAVFKEWKVLVADEEKIYFPICVKKKFGIKYLFQPPYTQRFDFIHVENGKIQPPKKITDFISNNFRFGEIMVGRQAEDEMLVFKKRRNLYLSTIQKSIGYKNYSNSLLRNIKKAKSFSNNILAINEWDYFIQFYKANLPQNLSKKSLYLKQLENLFHAAKRENSIHTIYHLDNENNPIGVIIFISANNIYHLIVSTNTKVGKKVGSTSILIDNMIDQIQESSGTLDFEGSDILGIYNFYQSFGPQEEVYFFLRWNKLSFPFNIIKDRV